MGRNLNALLNSAVRERREQSDERAPDAEGRDGAPAGEPARPAEVTRLPLAREPLPASEADRASPAPSDASRDPIGPVGGDDGVARAPSPSGSPPDDAESPRAPTPSARTLSVAPASDGAPTPSGTVPEDGRGDDAAAPPADTSSSGGTTRESAVSSDGSVGTPVEPSAGESVPDTARAALEDDLEVAPGDPPRPGDRLRMIGVERIRRGVFQPRRFFDQEALQELADSLKAQGMIQPVIVRPFGGAFELIAGERRWRAAQIAGLTEIPAIVREMEDRTVAAVSLIENIQREDLNPLEEAQALTRLCDEFGMTHASVAESIGRSRASVSNLMRLLELHDEVKVLVDKGELDMGHARALLRVPKVDQPALALRVAKQGLTVRAVEKLIRTGMDKGADGPAAGAAPDRATDPDVERLEERLSGLLGAPVSIRHKAGGAGRLEIRYASLDELDGILAHIN